VRDGHFFAIQQPKKHQILYNLKRRHDYPIGMIYINHTTNNNERYDNNTRRTRKRRLGIDRIVLLIMGVMMSHLTMAFTFHNHKSFHQRQKKINRLLTVQRGATERIFSSVVDVPTINTKNRARTTTTTTTTTLSSTAATTYPTVRGTTVDSRQIISASGTRTYITAILVSHCLFCTLALAEDALMNLRASTLITDFTTLASTLSACNSTRSDNGLIGWINIPSTTPKETTTAALDVDMAAIQDDHDPNEHLNQILPKEARQTLLHMVTKPGDVVMVESSRGFHLIQIMDVMANVRKMATLRPRKFVQQRNQNDTTSNSTTTTKIYDFFSGDVTYKLESMGCQMNTADSERMEGQFINLGIRPHRNDGTESREPDIVVLNTCSIRDHAEQKVYSYLGPHSKRKREGDNVTLIVAGCVAQQEGLQLLRRSPEIDLVMGPQYANRIGDLLLDVQMGNQVLATSATHIMEDSTKPRRGSTVVAWVNVIYGCNERCTFCIVPTTRGVEQSRPVESIVREVQDLVQNQGYKEITLLGQNIDAYGRDMIPKRKFSDLLRVVGSIPGLERLRFVTSHPRYMSMGVIDAVAETSTACESFHIPFQSGSNTILSFMGRGHTREKYLRIVDRIRTVCVVLFLSKLGFWLHSSSHFCRLLF
jgi:Uncharacterized protein family UPF0004/Radical SAM superfamily